MPRKYQVDLPQVPPVTYVDESADASHQNPAMPMKGITCWVNKGNGFAVMEINHRCDPEKDNEAYRNHKASLMDGREGPEFNRFFENSWVHRGGKSVFGEMLVPRGDDIGSPLKHHVIPLRATIPEWWSRRRGMDPGSVNPFAVGWWAISPEGIIILYDELYVRNTYAAVIETPAGRLSGLGVIKYLMYVKTGKDEIERTYIDPSAKNRQLKLGMGPESPRVNILEELREIPYPVYAYPARRSGDDPVDADKMRRILFRRRFYPALTSSTRAVLGLDYSEKGYELFTGYFSMACIEHVREWSNLRWAEPSNPDENAVERIQNRDNHSYDEAIYALLSEPWEPKRSRREAPDPMVDYEAYRKYRMKRALEKAGKSYGDRQNRKHGIWGEE